MPRIPTASMPVLWPLAVVVGGGTMLAGQLAWRAQRAPSVSGADGLIGRCARVQDLDRAGDTGSVRLDGAWWRARRRDGLLAPGQTVRVVDLDGLQLIVEVASQPARPAPADAEPPVSRAQPHQADRSTAKEARS